VHRPVPEDGSLPPTGIMVAGKAPSDLACTCPHQRGGGGQGAVPENLLVTCGGLARAVGPVVLVAHCEIPPGPWLAGERGEVIQGGEVQITSCPPGGAEYLLEKLQARSKGK
jgi:hypothetical protein